MSNIASGLGFEMPPDFPCIPYDKIRQHIGKRSVTKPTEWKMSAMGWNGIAYRYRALTEYDEIFTTSIRKSNSPGHEERYLQDNALFEFFTCCVSCIECLCFSLYCMASTINVERFPILSTKELRNIYPDKVKKLFQDGFPTDVLSIHLSKTLEHQNWESINNYRDFLSHRGSLPRSFYEGGDRHGMATYPINPKDPSNNWQYDFELNENTTKSFRFWLAEELANIFGNMELFYSTRLNS
jgi:hypothetical protein